jgi:hypothetical protein
MNLADWATLSVMHPNLLLFRKINEKNFYLINSVLSVIYIAAVSA